jgi:diguanylate cyclase (GGDEF)-like protein
MKQLQFTFKDRETLDAALGKIKAHCDYNRCASILIQLFTEILDRDIIEKFCSRIEKQLPEALYAGCSSNGNIVAGDFSGDSVALICTFFDHPSTRVEVLQYRLTADNQEEVAGLLSAEVDKRDWVKGVQLLTTIRGMSMSGLCEGLSKVREDVQIFGGGAFSEDINDQEACVFSKESGYSKKGIIFILTGGPDLHVKSSHVTGWKPLGSYLNVTATDGYVLKELNGRPAYETYYKYLKIKNDENFFSNTLEFPFLFHQNGIDIMRAPVASNPDGSLTMTSDMEQDIKARLAYGDPWTILESTWAEQSKLVEFAPDCIFVFSCAGRRTFWGNDKVGEETEAYQEVAPTSGFYTSGEFLRHGPCVIQHNVTQVIAAFREGDPKKREIQIIKNREALFEGRVSIISRISNFIKVTMEELDEATRQLSTMAVTDALTSLYNRGEIQRRITEEIEEKQTDPVYLVMLDLDNFKQVNDTYGHKEGDNVLIRVSGLLKETMVNMEGDCASGRWGGEEFMILMPGFTKEAVLAEAERIRSTMEKIRFQEAGQVTISVGVTKVIPGESADKACIRVDEALYEAKRTGKNKIVFLE